MIMKMMNMIMLTTSYLLAVAVVMMIISCNTCFLKVGFGYVFGFSGCRVRKRCTENPVVEVKKGEHKQSEEEANQQYQEKYRSQCGYY